MESPLTLKLDGLRVLVVGDIMIDHYLWGNCDRISPEAPVPVVDIIHEETMLGGAGNVVKNLKSFGVSVDILSVIGDDVEGDRLCDLLQRLNATTFGMHRESGRKTTKKSRILSSNHQMLRVDKETRTPIDSSSEKNVLSHLRQNINLYDVILISDYAKGMLTASLTRQLIDMANERKIITIVDPKGSDFSKYRGASFIKPNKREASIASGINIIDRASLLNAAAVLHNLVECQAVVITMSEQGIAIFDGDLEVIPTKANEVFDVTGAGDTVLASLGICLGSKLGLRESCDFSNHAAAIVVSKIGSAVTTCEEVFTSILRHEQIAD